MAKMMVQETLAIINGPTLQRDPEPPPPDDGELEEYDSEDENDVTLEEARDMDYSDCSAFHPYHGIVRPKGSPSPKQSPTTDEWEFVKKGVGEGGEAQGEQVEDGESDKFIHDLDRLFSPTTPSSPRGDPRPGVQAFVGTGGKWPRLTLRTVR